MIQIFLFLGLAVPYKLFKFDSVTFIQNVGGYHQDVIYCNKIILSFDYIDLSMVVLMLFMLA